MAPSQPLASSSAKKPPNPDDNMLLQTEKCFHLRSCFAVCARHFSFLSFPAVLQELLYSLSCSVRCTIFVFGQNIIHNLSYFVWGLKCDGDLSVQHLFADFPNKILKKLVFIIGTKQWHGNGSEASSTHNK